MLPLASLLPFDACIYTWATLVFWFCMEICCMSSFCERFGHGSWNFKNLFKLCRCFVGWNCFIVVRSRWAGLMLFFFLKLNYRIYRRWEEHFWLLGECGWNFHSLLAIVLTWLHSFSKTKIVYLFLIPTVTYINDLRVFK